MNYFQYPLLFTMVGWLTDHDIYCKNNDLQIHLYLNMVNLADSGSFTAFQTPNATLNSPFP